MSKFDGMSYGDLVRHAGYTGSTDQQVAATLALANRVDRVGDQLDVMLDVLDPPHHARAERDAGKYHHLGWYVMCPQCGGGSFGNAGEDFELAKRTASDHNIAHPGGATKARLR